MNTNQKGFTLIELLVVVAIIGILASVVLVATKDSRNKSKDAAIKSNLTNLRSEIEIWYYNNANSYGSYANAVCPTAVSTGIFSDSKIIKILRGATSQSSTSRCVAGGSNWAIAVELKTGKQGVLDTIPDAWCVDYLSKGKAYTYASTTEGVWSAINGSNACK